MTSKVCLTVDVEDWYDGMRRLGHHIASPASTASGLEQLGSTLLTVAEARITLFVVGDYVPRVRQQLIDLAAAGHEIASHGPDHGYLPTQSRPLLEWLKRGRECLEDALQADVMGMRSPRFSFPDSLGLMAYRDLLAEAGFRYVSDRSLLGSGSPVAELPVLMAGRLPVGGGSYQRLLPRSIVKRQTARSALPAVLYYHSYDFGAELPTVRATRSFAVAKQVLGRNRVAPVFRNMLVNYGSDNCDHARVTL